MKISLNERFSQQEYLGSGDYGEVYSAHDTQSHDTVALKVSPSNSFDHEYTILKGLDHPNIVKVKECGRYRSPEETGAYLTMELVDTGRHYGMGPRPNTYIRGVLLGLAYLHSQGVVHGDMQRDNNLAAVDGTARIIDFGVARRVPHWLGKRLTMRGIYSYKRDVQQTFHQAFFLARMNHQGSYKQRLEIEATLARLKSSAVIQAWFKNQPPILATLQAELDVICPEDEALPTEEAPSRSDAEAA